MTKFEIGTADGERVFCFTEYCGTNRIFIPESAIEEVLETASGLDEFFVNGKRVNGDLNEFLDEWICFPPVKDTIAAKIAAKDTIAAPKMKPPRGIEWATYLGEVNTIRHESIGAEADK